MLPKEYTISEVVIEEKVSNIWAGPGLGRGAAAVKKIYGRGGTLLHFSPQPHPCLVTATLKAPNASHKKCSRQAEKWRSVTALIYGAYETETNPWSPFFKPQAKMAGRCSLTPG